MVFVGHLDVMAALDRACRRAALPVSADESPFAARQRIYTVLALPLGATSSSEWLELTLWEARQPEAVRAQLQVSMGVVACVRLHRVHLLCLHALAVTVVNLCQGKGGVVQPCPKAACMDPRLPHRMAAAPDGNRPHCVTCTALGPGPAAYGAGAAVCRGGGDKES